MEDKLEIEMKLELAKIALEAIIAESAELSPASTIASETLKRIN